MKKYILARGREGRQYYISIPKISIDLNLLSLNQEINLFTNDQMVLIVELISSFYKRKIAGNNQRKLLKLVLDLNFAKIPANIDLGIFTQIFDFEDYLYDFVSEDGFSIKENKFIENGDEKKYE